MRASHVKMEVRAYSETFCTQNMPQKIGNAHNNIRTMNQQLTETFTEPLKSY
jgi:hypothetical protein